MPTDLLPMSGAVFYSGADAFSGTSPIYLLGLNPGGDSEAMAHNTVEGGLRELPPANWSAYRDALWADGRPPGTWGLQPRVLHLFSRLGLDAGEVPASNLVFVRSRREASFAGGQMGAYADVCWPFHAAVIEALHIQVVVCLGKTAGSYARQQLDAHREVGRFVETNGRGWRSYVHAGPSVKVATVTHPSIADWRNPAADASDLIAVAITT